MKTDENNILKMNDDNINKPAILFLPDSKSNSRVSEIKDKVPSDYDVIGVFSADNYIEGVEYNISREDQKREFLKDFKSIIEKLKKTTTTLIIEHLELLKKNRDCLKLLQKSSIKFSVLDFEKLNQDNLEILMEFFNYSAKERGRKISFVSQQKRKSRVTEGDSKENRFGNINIASKKNIAKAKYKRILNRYLDKTNIDIGIQLVEWKDEKGLNFNLMANTLNDEGILSSRNGKFHGKSTQRIYTTRKEIEERFEEKEIKVEDLTDNKILGFKNFQDFEDRVSFKLDLPNTSEHNFEMIIKDNKEEEVLKKSFQFKKGKLFVQHSDDAYYPVEDNKYKVEEKNKKGDLETVEYISNLSEDLLFTMRPKEEYIFPGLFSFELMLSPNKKAKKVFTLWKAYTKV